MMDCFCSQKVPPLNVITRYFSSVILSVILVKCYFAAVNPLLASAPNRAVKTGGDQSCVQYRKQSFPLSAVIQTCQAVHTAVFWFFRALTSFLISSFLFSKKGSQVALVSSLVSLVFLHLPPFFPSELS